MSPEEPGRATGETPRSDIEGSNVWQAGERGVEWRRGEFVVTTDPTRIDVPLVARELAGSYWARGIPEDVVRRSIAGSIAFGLLHGNDQVGFARVVTDRATFAWIGDVFVLEPYRGRGLALWLVRCMLEHPELQGLRRWMLATRDAHGLYEKAGFSHAGAGRFMEIADLDMYRRGDG